MREYGPDRVIGDVRFELSRESNSIHRYRVPFHAREKPTSNSTTTEGELNQPNPNVASLRWAITITGFVDRNHQNQRSQCPEPPIDGLTALYNRGYLMKRVPEEVERANRYGLDLCLLMADLDHFKAVNDRHGHLAGDEVLKFFGKVLSACTRNTDIAARFGGEEFCIVLTNTELAASQNIAERICEQIRDRQHCGKDGDVFQVTCSIGLASLEPHMKDADTLLEQAMPRSISQNIKAETESTQGRQQRPGYLAMADVMSGDSSPQGMAGKAGRRADVI